jgi:hypothetical protein
MVGFPAYVLNFRREQAQQPILHIVKELSDLIPAGAFRTQSIDNGQ